MTLNIDPRAGSEKLIKPMGKIGLGTKVTTERMEFADVAFMGKGENGTPIPVGIEYKKLGDLLQCMRDDRFVRHQLPGLRDCYEDIWLIVEGEYRPGTNGLLTVRRGRSFGFLPGKNRQQMPYTRLAKFLISLEIRGGVRVVHTTSIGETVEFIAALYKWWTFAPLEHHKSHIAVSLKRRFTDASGFMPAKEEVRMLAQVDGISKDKAHAILSHFGCIANIPTKLNLTSVAGWTGVRGIGTTLRNRIIDVLTRPYKEIKANAKPRPRKTARHR